MMTETNTTTAAAGLIYTSYTMDYTSQVEHARRADGQWFSRIQYRDPRYGYKWSAWRMSGAPSERATVTERKARLPK